MIITAIAFFALSALLGLLLLTFVLKGKHTPKAVVFSHGPLAVVGLVLMAVYMAGQPPGPVDAMVLFLIAATSGLVMVVRDLSGKSVPKWLAITHGLLAASGLVLLLIFQCRS